MVKTIDAGGDVDIALSPDRRRLYLAAIEYSEYTIGGKADWKDYLTALDTATGQVLWKQPIEGSVNGSRIMYIGGDGPSALTVSPDGSRLLIQKQAGWDASFTMIDTATGKVSVESPRLSTCVGADLTFSSDGRELYLTCYAHGDLRFLNATTLQVEATVSLLSIPLVTPHTLPSADGRWLYVVTGGPQVALVSTQKRSLERHVYLDSQYYSHLQTVALSADGSRLVIGIRWKGPDQPVDQIRVYDTRSWTEVERVHLDGLHLDGEAQQLAVGRRNNDLLLLFENEYSDGVSLHTRTSLATLDLAHPEVASPLKLDLAGNEQLVRLDVAR